MSKNRMCTGKNDKQKRKIRKQQSVITDNITLIKFPKSDRLVFDK